MLLSTFLLSIKTYIPIAIIQMLIASFVGIFLNSYSDEKFTPRKATGEKYSLAERLLINLVSTLIGIIGILILGGIFVYLSIWITNSLLGLQLSPLNACMYTTIFAFIIFLVIFVFLKLYIDSRLKSLKKLLNELEELKKQM